MGRKLIVQVASIAVIILCTVTFYSKSLAQSSSGDKFICSNYLGYPATMVLLPTSQTYVPLILWTNPAFIKSGYTPEKRCKMISPKFQDYFGQSASSNRKMEEGTVHGHPVICVVRNSNEDCDKDNLLITLEPGSNPTKALTELEALQKYSSSNRPLELSDVPTGIAGYDTNGNAYINLDNLLQNLEQ